MQRLSPDNFGACENILTKLFQATWWTLVHKQKLEVQGKARREAARRRNSECSRPTAQRWLAGGAAQRPIRRAAGQSPLRSRPTAIAARGISTT